MLKILIFCCICLYDDLSAVLLCYFVKIQFNVACDHLASNVEGVVGLVVVVCDNRSVWSVTPRRLDADSFWLLAFICILNFVF